MRNAIWPFIKRFWGWVLIGLTGLLFAARLVSEVVGTTSFIEDLTKFLAWIKPVTDFFARQPEWAFYPLCLVMIAVGVIACAANWKPVLATLKARTSTPAVVESPKTAPKLPDWGLGDMVRYIACESGWGVEVGENKNWLVLLDREIIDRFSQGALTAYGRFTAKYMTGDGTPKSDKISTDFWSYIEMKLHTYFVNADDTNRVDGSDYGYFDVKVFSRDVRRIWPSKDASAVVKLPNLAEALKKRNEKIGLQ